MISSNNNTKKVGNDRTHGTNKTVPGLLIATNIADTETTKNDKYTTSLSKRDDTKGKTIPSLPSDDPTVVDNTPTAPGKTCSPGPAPVTTYRLKSSAS